MIVETDNEEDPKSPDKFLNYFENEPDDSFSDDFQVR